MFLPTVIGSICRLALVAVPHAITQPENGLLLPRRPQPLIVHLRNTQTLLL